MDTAPAVRQETPSGDAVTALESAVDGPVLLPGTDEFAAECAGFNLLVVHRPAVVVGATGPQDVQAAVRFAVQHGLPVAVVCTGHQPFEPVQGAVLITTSRMDAVEIDVAARTARTGAGAVWQQVVDAAAPAGLAPLNGSSAKVGVTGYVLGGGLSPTLGRTYGWAADHVRAIEIVTADGELRRVTATAEPELFWAVRGAKGNFGVVTAMEIDLFPVSTYFGGGLFYAGEHTEAVLRAYREWITTAPDELSSSVALLRLPPSPEVPAPLRGRLAVHVRVCFLGPAVEGERLVAPLRALAPTIIDTVMPTPYRAFASVHQDPVDPVPLRMRNALLTGLTDEVVDALVAFGGPGSRAHGAGGASPRCCAGAPRCGAQRCRRPGRRRERVGRRHRARRGHRARDRAAGPAHHPPPAVEHRTEVPQLHERSGRRRVRLHRADLPAAANRQARLRPRERLPAQQPQHPARLTGAAGCRPAAEPGRG
ncbi:hypothetical protein GCM10009610_70180 [Pseudonocardia xinjiangensis]